MYALVLEFTSGSTSYFQYNPSFQSFTDCAVVASTWSEVLNIMKDFFDPKMTIDYLGCEIL